MRYRGRTEEGEQRHREREREVHEEILGGNHLWDGARVYTLSFILLGMQVVCLLRVVVVLGVLGAFRGVGGKERGNTVHPLSEGLQHEHQCSTLTKRSCLTSPACYWCTPRGESQVSPRCVSNEWLELFATGQWYSCVQGSSLMEDTGPPPSVTTDADDTTGMGSPTDGRFPGQADIKWNPPPELISKEAWRKIFPKNTDASAMQLRMELNEALNEYGIDTPARIAMFIGLAAVDSEDFTKLEDVGNGEAYDGRCCAPCRIPRAHDNYERLTDMDYMKCWLEDWAPSKGKHKCNDVDAICRAVGKLPDLGNCCDGDGFRFRGRGIFRMVGRLEYQRLSRVLGAPLETEPDLLAMSENAFRSAAWFFRYGSKSGDFNVLADECNLAGATKGLEGNCMDWQERGEYYDRALQMLGGDMCSKWNVVCHAEGELAPTVYKRKKSGKSDQLELDMNPEGIDGLVG